MDLSLAGWSRVFVVAVAVVVAVVCDDEENEGNMLPGFRNMSATLLFLVLLLGFDVGSSSSGGAGRTPPPTLENWDCSLAVRISRQPWGPRPPSAIWWPVEEEFQGSNRGI